MRKLRIEWEGSEPLVFDGDLVTIGRSSSNMVVIRDSRISSVHGEIVRRAQDFFFRDLGSTNGSLVRTAEAEVVVDGNRVREVLLSDGDELLLGDRQVPVVLRVAIQEDELFDGDGQTIVARRVIGSVDDLGTQIVENPLASRQTLTRLFHFYAEISNMGEIQDLVDATCGFALELLSKNVFVAGFLKTPEGLERVSLVTRDAAHTPVVSSDDLKRWFPDTIAGQSALVIGVPEVVRKRLPSLKMIAAVPLPSGEGILGILILGRNAEFSDFDLDLLNLVAHHAAIQAEKIGLIEQLREANTKLSNENRDLREQLGDSTVERPIIGKSHSLQRAIKQAGMVAKTGTTVLILGETGTGKELLARYVHAASDRAEERFAALNCGALAETLLESELFGHVKGAFTGAERDKKGLFQAAEGGTLFLDEIGDVSPALQVKLLRVLEAAEVTPVGSTQPVQTDVRVVGATHRDLDKMVAEGTFREDLLYRINVFPIELPALRDRPGDITILAEHFLKIYMDKLGKRLSGYHKDTFKRLEAYPWPGNVRELENEIHRAVLLADEGKFLQPENLSDRMLVTAREMPRIGGSLKEAMARVEEEYIRRVLKEHGGNRTQSAKSMGISRQALTEKLKKYKIGRKFGNTFQGEKPHR